MAHSNDGVITRPITDSDIKAVLGISSNDLASWCTAEEVNKWSKGKPVVFAKKEQLTAANFHDANYGIDLIPSWGRADYMFNFLFASQADRQAHTNWWPDCDVQKQALSLEYWIWQPPTGGSTSPYRMTDFENYYHEAEAPIKPIEGNTIKISPMGIMRIVFPRGAQTTKTLKLDDLTWPGSSSVSIGNMFFGIFAKRTSGTGSNPSVCALMKNGDSFVMMREVLGGDYIVNVQLTASNTNYEGTWKIFPVICRETFNQSATPPSGSQPCLCPLTDHTKAITVSIEYGQVVIISASGYRDMSDYKSIYVTVTVRNQNATAWRWKVTVQLYNSSGQAVSGFSKTVNVSTQCPASGTASERVTFTTSGSAQFNQFQNGYFTAVAELQSGYDVVFMRSSSWGQTQLTDGPAPPVNV